MIKLDYTHIEPFLAAGDLEHFGELAAQADALLESGIGAGSEYLGWLHLPSSIDKNMLEEIAAAAEELRSKTQVIIVIGIGGSCLGSRAAMEALGNSFDFLKKNEHPRVVFAGQNLSEDYMWELMDAVRDYSLGAIAVSKSGTTLEPAIALQIVKSEIERRYGRGEAARRIIAVTDGRHGTLRSLADSQGYKSFTIPDNIGGRFSVFTPAGLLPLAAAGIDIAEFAGGAASMERALGAGVPFENNPAQQYAAVRNALYAKGFKIEILASYEPKLHYFGEWWKQLFGETEGKQGNGIFPATVSYTADLHSMGQYIQDGSRIVFETVVNVLNPRRELFTDGIMDGRTGVADNQEMSDCQGVSCPSDNLEMSDKQGVLYSSSTDSSAIDTSGRLSVTDNGLSGMNGMRISEVNRLAEKAVTMAHVSGGVPNIKIELPQLSPQWLGAIFYLFERACGISGYMSGINPFDQPGVETYKKNLMQMLGKQ